MSAFHYTGRDEGGRFVSGTIVAPSRLDAISMVGVSAITLTSVQAAGSVVGRVSGALNVLSSDAGSRVAAFRSLAALVGAGIPLQRSLHVVTAECSNGRLREALSGVCALIEQGSSLETALSQRPREFPVEICAMVRAGEISGSLDDALRRIATYVERSHALQKRVTGALVYPVVVATMALGLVLFLLGSVVPAFAAMFADMSVQLPLVTEVVLAIGRAVDDPRWWLGGCVALGAACAAMKSAGRIGTLRLAFDRWRLRLPVFGNVMCRSEVAACARTIGSLANAGVAIETALQAARDGARSAAIRASLDGVLEAVRLGDGVAGAFARSGTFGSVFAALARAGEESGTLGDMLVRVAEFEELEVEATVDTLGSVMEPLLIVVLGGIVGTIVAAVLVPLYSMIGSIK